ncbi:MAG: hypothetical protein ABFC80_09335 [Coriobacteriales bacterium]|nr:hypothetical protein [Nocardiaceae bacterium]
MSDRLLTISFGDGKPLPNNVHLARITAVEQLTWAALTDRLTRTPPVTTDKSSAGWYCCAEFKGRHRDTENFVARHCLALDYDHITREQANHIKARYTKYAHVMYTTASHTVEAPRIRVVMPLSRPATIDEFQAVSRAVAALSGIELASRESHVPAQMMYMPTVKPGAKFAARIGVSMTEWIDVDHWLSTYVDWTDKSSWPHRADHDTLTQGEKVDPTEKPGVIGAWCRAFSITEAIDRFELPFERVR